MALADALAAVERFAAPDALTFRIADIEHSLSMLTREKAADALTADGIDPGLLQAALAVKRVSGQINVIVHAVGLLVALPHVLEPGERVESLSLGAGNTGRLHDLETDRQIAEFTFIDWRGGSESIRQNKLFIDLFTLASADTPKRRVLYVVGRAIPLRFLNNRRAVKSVLSKNDAVASRFRELHGGAFLTVRDYYATVRDIVEIVDLADIVPELRALE
jgi:hypothetical protein